MSDTQPAKRRRGRPEGSGDGLTETIPVQRVTPEQKAKWLRLGGPEWTRKKIDAAREPK